MNVSGSNSNTFLTVEQRKQQLFEKQGVSNPTTIKTESVAKQRSNTQPPPKPQPLSRNIQSQKPTTTVAPTQRKDVSTPPTSPFLVQTKSPSNSKQMAHSPMQKKEIATPLSFSSPLEQPKSLTKLPEKKPAKTVQTPTQKKEEAPTSLSLTPLPQPKSSSIVSKVTSAVGDFFTRKNAAPVTPSTSPKRSNNAAPATPTPPPQRSNAAPVTSTPPPQRSNNAAPVISTLLCQRSVDIIPPRASVVPAEKVNATGDLIKGNWTTNFEDVKALVFHPALASRIFAGGGYLKVKEKITAMEGMEEVEYIVLIAPKDFQFWRTNGHLQRFHSPRILCFLEIGAEAKIRHYVGMLKHDRLNTEGTAPPSHTIGIEEHHKYVFISKEKMDQKMQSVQILKILQEKHKKNCYNEYQHYSGSQSAILLDEVKKLLKIE